MKKIRVIKVTFDEKVTWSKAEEFLDSICQELDWMGLTAVPELTEEFLDEDAHTGEDAPQKAGHDE